MDSFLSSFSHLLISLVIYHLETTFIPSFQPLTEADRHPSSSPPAAGTSSVALRAMEDKTPGQAAASHVHRQALLSGLGLGLGETLSQALSRALSGQGCRMQDGCPARCAKQAVNRSRRRSRNPIGGRWTTTVVGWRGDQHPTLNIQRPTPKGSQVGSWALSVGCWMLSLPLHRRAPQAGDAISRERERERERELESLAAA